MTRTDRARRLQRREAEVGRGAGTGPAARSRLPSSFRTRSLHRAPRLFLFTLRGSELSRARRADGARVLGLDLSMPLLRQALRRSARPRPAYVRGDMRALPLRCARFGAIVSFFTSFGYFEDASEDVRVLAEVRRALVPGGAFLS